MTMDLAEMRDESNLVRRFMRDCTDYDPNAMVSITDLYASFRSHYEENTDRSNVPGPKSMGRAIAALNEGKIVQEHDLRFRKTRYYAGIKLNDVGLDHWQATFRSIGQRGDAARISSSEGNVNQTLPVEWSSKPEIIKMRSRHGPF
jgi:hypothetical protein